MFIYKDKLAGTDEIIKCLFDPGTHNKFIPLQGKILYLEHFLELKWPEICGANLAKHCSVERLVGQELYIRTSNSMLANELYMMQGLFLQKINAYLLGSVIIKKLHFQTGAAIRRQERQEREASAPPPPVIVRCPLCGAQMRQGPKLCSICEREQRQKLRLKLAELLRIQPWLKYEDCLQYFECDKILFTSVKDSLKAYYYLRVQDGIADKKETMMAVLFLTEKHPEEMTEKLYNNALAFLLADKTPKKWR